MTFVPEAALIALREGLEALLITGILIGLVTRLGHPEARKHVWGGLAAGAAASLALGVVVQRFLLDAFEERGGAEWFELAAALAAVAVLTYMVFWMWKHTRELVGTLRREVAAALTAGSLLTISFLVFASTLREGVEIVLFYAALANRATPVDLAWSGLVGFAASAVLVYALLKGLARVDLQRFFAWTGVLLVFVAAGLLVHSVSAATGLGLLEPAPAIWDTSAAIPDEAALGRVLHALVGYTATPTLLQAVLYFGYVFIAGGLYLLGLGAFHRRRAGHRELVMPRVAAALVVLLLAGGVTANGALAPTDLVMAGHDHGDGDDHGAYGEGPVALPEDAKVGILLRSHGEPVHYNETTYPEFAHFVRNLLELFGYGDLLLIDQGTVLLDRAHPYAPGPRLDADLMDAWTRTHAGPAVYVGSPFPQVQETRVPMLDGYYVSPGGPGLGEPDVLELAGLGAYLSWEQLGGESPMHFGKLQALEHAKRLLEERYGDRVVVQLSYHLAPHVGPGETDAEAAAAFVREGVDLVVDAYTSAIRSDVMDGCMMRPHLLHALDDAGYRGPVVHAGLPATSHHFMDAVVDKVNAEVARHPVDQRIAVFLTHHGANPASQNPCGTGPDQYHENAETMFAHATKHLFRTYTDERVRFFHVYGQGAGAADDGVLSPLEAVAEAKEWGADFVVDVPYELSADGFDNLLGHRGGYGLDPREAPHWDRNHETYLTVDGVPVHITSASFGHEGRGAALADVVERALAEAFAEADN